MSQQNFLGFQSTSSQAIPQGQQLNASATQQNVQNQNQGDDFLQQKNFTVTDNPMSQAHTEGLVYPGQQPFPFTSTSATPLKRMSTAQRQVQQDLLNQQYQKEAILQEEASRSVQSTLPYNEIPNQQLGTAQQNFSKKPEAQSSEDQDSEKSNKQLQNLSPEEISNQQYLQKQELSNQFNRPSRNERLTRLEQEVSRMSELITQQQLDSERQTSGISTNINNVYNILQNLKDSFSRQEVSAGYAHNQTLGNNQTTVSQNQYTEKVPEKYVSEYHSPGGSKYHYETYSKSNPNTGYSIPPYYSARPVDSKIMYGAPSGGDISGKPPIPPPPPYPPNDSSSAPQNQNQSPIQVFMKTRRDYHLRNYNGDDNPQAWLNQFLKFCIRTEVPQEEYLDEVRDFLTGKALGWYERNYQKFNDNFETFKELLKEQYRKDPAIYETQLSLTKQNYEEDLRSFLKRLELIAKPACLDESRIRLAFLRGIKDKELQAHARQTYLFNNGEKPLEHILIALQDYETHLKSLRKTKDGSSAPRAGGYNKNSYHNTSSKEDPKNQTNSSQATTTANRTYNGDKKNTSNTRPAYKANVLQSQEVDQNTQARISPEEIAKTCEGEDPEQYHNYYQTKGSSDSAYVIVENQNFSGLSQNLQNQEKLYNVFDSSTQLTDQPAINTKVDQQITQDLQFFEECLSQQQDQTGQSFQSIDKGSSTVENPLFENQNDTSAFSQKLYSSSPCEDNVQLTALNTGTQQCTANLTDHNEQQTQQFQQGQNTIQNVTPTPCTQGVQVFSVEDFTPTYEHGTPGSSQGTKPVTVPSKMLSLRRPDIERFYPKSMAYQLIPNHILRYINIKINGITSCALVDTGCTSVILTYGFIQHHNLEPKLVQRFRQLTTAVDNTIGLRDILPDGQITFFEEEFKNLVLVADMMIVAPNPSFEVIIGQSFLNFFLYQVAADGLHLRLTPDSTTVLIRYVVDLIYQVYERDVDDLGVLTRSSLILSKEQIELYPNFPTDKRDILLIDPPWTYYTNKKGIREPTYQQLSFQQLLRLPIREIAKDDGILLLWVTSPMFKQALTLISTYGYTYKTILFVWVKLDADNNVQTGYGHYTDPCCEYLVLSTKGQFLQFLQPDIKISQLFSAQNLKKSRKPIVIYDLLSKVFKLQNFNNLEIFSTMPSGSELFSHYGNNVPGRYQQSLNIPKETVNILNEQYLIQDEYGTIKEPSTGQQIFLNQEELTKTYEKEALLSEDEVLSQLKICDPFYKDFLKNQASIFSRGDADLGQTDVITHKIQLLPGAIPKRQRPYHTGQLENKAIEAIISEIESIEVIRSESSPYQHPVVLVRKPNGKYRMCINYKYLNSQTVDDKYPIPLISYLFTLLAKGKVFTKLDGKSGFWQVLMDPESIPLTGFVTHNGQYVYLRMPFGLKNAPATFQRLMNEVLREYINDFVIVYIDDVIVYSPDPETHLVHLDKVFSKIRAAKIKLGADKCEIGFPSMDVLGHTITHQEIRPKKERVEAIHRIAVPSNVTELRSFIGLCSYYRQYIPKFAQIASQLFPLMNKGVPFLWEDRHTQAFNKLKNSLADNSVLQLLLNDRPLVLYTDFSILGLGAVLCQKVSDRKEKVIEFASRTLQKYERSLDSYCGEVLAVYWAINKFRQYILSVPFPLEIVTDNKALEWVLKLGTSSPIRKIQRWTIDIDSYSYYVRHRKGTTHINADALSRLVGQIPQELQPSIPACQNDSVMYMEDVGNLACTRCKLDHEDDHMPFCDRCGDANHIGCLGITDLTKGPFYCPNCQSIIDSSHKTDIIYNKQLYKYLENCKDNLGSNGLDPTGLSELNFSTSDLSMFQQFALFYDRLFKLDKTEHYLLVPTEVERKIILKEQHHLCGHGGIERTKSKVSEQYWWKHLHKDVVEHINTCEICNITNPKFSSQPTLHPIQKGISPFQIVSADLITNLVDAPRLIRDDDDIPLTDEEIINIRARVNRPRGPGRPKKGGSKQVTTKSNKRKQKGKLSPVLEEDMELNEEKEKEIAKDGIFKHCIVVIDVFSKYVELGALKSKSSEELYQWFDQHIICRHGSPFVLRTDQGTEFMGGLSILCQDHDIEMQKISAHYPQANGQAEATVKNVTKILRKFLLSKHYQYLHWWDMLPYVQRSINTSVTKATSYTPHEILYGHKMRQIDSVNYTLKSFQEGFVDLTPAEVTEYVTQLQISLADLQDRVKIQLNKQDEVMKRQYEKLTHKEFEFTKGQRVYVQKQRTNKLEPKVDGPYIFEQYSPDKTHADVLNPDSGRSQRINTNILSPATVIQFVYL